MDYIKNLYQSLSERKRPEDIAEVIKNYMSDHYSVRERIILEKAAQHALVRRHIPYTSMPEDFRKIVGAEKQFLKASELFDVSLYTNFDYCDVGEIQSALEEIEMLVKKEIGSNNFIRDRLNKNERKKSNIQLSKRQYNKRWRLLKRIEEKQKKLQRELHKLEFEKIAKHGLAHHLSYSEFAQDADSACFIAYYTARCNLRSVFTNTTQERPFDEICEMLLTRCRLKCPITTNWWAISHVYISDFVTSHLTEEQKGLLLGRWTCILEEISKFLHDLWLKNNINRQTMIVKKGNDSSTWNHAAGAWNKARDQWMHLIYALGLEIILENICIGKVLRLMAGDIAAWHLESKGTLDPDTYVWNELPLPWEVLQGRVVCTKDDIIVQCLKVNLDPEKSGWIAPKSHSTVQFKTTPELVHGVEISSPFLASILKRNKFFSGKG